MIRKTLYALAIATASTAMVGCSTNASFDPTNLGGDKQVTAQSIAYAATAKYPTTAPANSDLKVASFTHRGEIKIVNFSHEPINDAIVWVNGLYVAKVGSLPASGTVTIDSGKFYDSTGRVLNTDTTPVNRVQVEAGSGVWNTLGPAVEQ